MFFRLLPLVAAAVVGVYVLRRMRRTAEVVRHRTMCLLTGHSFSTACFGTQHHRYQPQHRTAVMAQCVCLRFVLESLGPWREGPDCSQLGSALPRALPSTAQAMVMIATDSGPDAHEIHTTLPHAYICDMLRFDSSMFVAKTYHHRVFLGSCSRTGLTCTATCTCPGHRSTWFRVSLQLTSVVVPYVASAYAHIS